MSLLYLSVLDPSGHRRNGKIGAFPAKVGTRLDEKHSLRDPRLQEDAIQIERRPEGWTLKVLQDGLVAQVGDLRLQSFEIPMHVPVRLGDTEIIFSEIERKIELIEFPSGEKEWHTESEKGLDLLRMLKRASQSKLSIYLSGETGTGKEMLARLAHVWSDRAAGPFIPINCGALPVSLAESELFGHVKGSFTGAVRDRTGAFLQAHNGTLFLDEVGDLPPEIQVKLLRFLESGEIRPVGSDRTLHADARIVCATHKPLAKLVQDGKFRQDLYYRLASVPVEIPSLRARPEDIKALAVRFAREHEKVLTPEAILKLQANSWPGNVRELRHAVERAAGVAGPFEKVIHAKDFDFLSEENSSFFEESVLPGVCNLKEMEKVMILRALKIAMGNRTDAAKYLGIARSTLFEMMKRHKIVGPRSTEYWMEKLKKAPTTESESQ